MKLSEYLVAERGRTARVAKQAGIAPAFLSQMAKGVRPVPVAKVKPLVAACDEQVTIYELRPHDWHLIWPELVGAYGAPQLAEAAAA